MREVKVLKPSRLNGQDVAVGETVTIENDLASAWIRSKRARIAVQRTPGRSSKTKTPKKQKDPELVQLSKTKLVVIGKGLGLDPKGFKGLNKEEIAARIEEVMRKNDEKDGIGEGQEEAGGSQDPKAEAPS